MNFLNYLKIKIPKEYRNLAMDTILKNHLSYKKSMILPDLSLEIIISTKNKKIYESIFSKNSIEAEFGESKGFLSVIEKYKNRYGIIFGIFILILSVYASSLFVWRIDVEGNINVSNEEIIETLEKSGFSVGSFVPNVNYDTLHNKFLLLSNDIAWISVNINGNVAKVKVRERLTEKEELKTTYTNVVSKYDAQITMIQLYNGKKVVSIGDVVKKGDILVSGVLNSQSQGTRYVHADAKIFAYVNKPIKINIPFKTTEKSYTGEIIKEKKIKIFSKSINFFSKGRNQYEFCDKIETTKTVVLFDKIKLPVEITTAYYRPYVMESKILSHKEAIDIAFLELRKEFDIATKNADIITKTTKTFYDENGFYIDCNLYCIEDIASLIEFEVE